MLTIVLGGARSGKSKYAQSLCEVESEIFYLATARTDSSDPEMISRIERHRNDRPSHWKIIEEPINVGKAIVDTVPETGTVLVDCITVWLSNLMWEERDRSAEDLERFVLEEMEKLAEIARRRNIILVTNEVGSGIVPDNPIARSFRDLQGFSNQFLAAKADRVILVVAGLPLTLK